MFKKRKELDTFFYDNGFIEKLLSSQISHGSFLLECQHEGYFEEILLNPDADPLDVKKIIFFLEEITSESRIQFRWDTNGGNQYHYDQVKHELVGFFPLNAEQFFILLHYVFSIIKPNITLWNAVILVNKWLVLATAYNSEMYLRFLDKIAEKIYASNPARFEIHRKADVKPGNALPFGPYFRLYTEKKGSIDYVRAVNDKRAGKFRRKRNHFTSQIRRTRTKSYRRRI